MPTTSHPTQTASTDTIPKLRPLVRGRPAVQIAASIAQLGERKTEDLEAPCSIHGRSSHFNVSGAAVVNGVD